MGRSKGKVERSKEEWRHIITVAMVFGLFDHELGTFFLKLLEEDEKDKQLSRRRKT